MKDEHYPIVEIDWVDSSTAHGWADYKALDLRCKAVGYLIAETPDRLVITDAITLSEQDPDGYSGPRTHCPQSIPRPAVLKVKYLRK